MKPRDFVSLLLSSFFLVARVASAGEGERVNFLSHGPGARAGALAETFTAVADDATAMYYNPAGLSFQRGSVYAEHTPVYTGGRYNFIGFHYPSNIGSFGFGAIQYATDGIELRQNIGDSPTEANASQTAWFVPFGTRFKNSALGDVAVGASLKRLDQNLANHRDTGFGLDAGLLYSKYLSDWAHLARPNFRLGISAKNLIAPSTRLDSSKETWPTNYKLGFAFSGNVGGQYRESTSQMVYDRFTVAIDAKKSPDRNNVEWQDLSTGLEYMFRDLFALRAGVGKEFSFGVGYGSERAPFAVDYSFLMTALVPQHRFSFSYFFGDAPSKPLVSPELRQVRVVQLDAKRLQDRALSEGQNYLRDQKYKDAIDQFEKAWVFSPTNTRLENNVDQAKNLLQADQLKQILEKVKSDSPSLIQEINRLHDEFHKALTKKNLGEAKRCMALLKALSPTNPVTTHVMATLETTSKQLFVEYMDQANVAFSKNDVGTSFQCFLKALEIYPKNPDALRQRDGLKDRYLRKMRFEAADLLIQDQLYKKAAIHYAKGETDECMDQLRELLRKNQIHEDGNQLWKFFQEKQMINTEDNNNELHVELPNNNQ